MQETISIESFGIIEKKGAFFDYLAALSTAIVTHFMLVTCVCCLP
jgi:hypothetical protein